MAFKEITKEVKKTITICDICGEKCRGLWLYIYAHSNSNSRSVAPKGRRQWYISLLTKWHSANRLHGYDICDRCVQELVENKLKEL